MSETQNSPAAEQKKETGSDQSHSNYGKGFMIRMGVLLGILLIVGGMFCYERFVMIPTANNAIAEAKALVKQKTSDGHGIPRDKIQEVMGREPSNSEDNKKKLNMDRKEGEPERDATILIETYSFPRILPFLKGGQFVTVVYRDLALSEVLPNQRFSMVNNPDNANIVVPDEEDRQMPTSSVGG